MVLNCKPPCVKLIDNSRLFDLKVAYICIKQRWEKAMTEKNDAGKKRCREKMMTGKNNAGQ
jgi:hypothetical protein